MPSADKPPEEFKGQVHFFGIDQQYFLSSAFPLGGSREGKCVLTATPSLRAADAFFPLTVSAGQTVTFDFGGFLGPKELDLLGSVRGEMPDGSAPAAGPEMEKSVDFGLWEVLCKVLLPTLKFFHKWGGNWGLAIILLTVTVKLILLPLTHRAMVSAEAMKKLQPKLEEIRKKFPDDRERQGTETMKLYQEAKVNPLGGCLPILLQLPVWGALYTTLRYSYELYGEPFIGPVWTDLTYHDPTYILPLALGVTMVITQRLQPQALDATQFFTVIMLNYPAGLALYIFTNNLLSIAQQFLLRRWLGRKKAATT
jgi:YidC/Oxa1 family membrane protein insertase